MSNRALACVRPKRPFGLLFILFSLSLYFHYKNKYARDEIRDPLIAHLRPYGCECSDMHVAFMFAGLGPYQGMYGNLHEIKCPLARVYAA